MKNKIVVLLVEDNPGDVELTMEALSDSVIPMNIIVASDGVEAMEMLRNPTEEKPRPDFILLDLNMPRKDGKQVLKEVKADSDLKSIPIVVMTTSSSEEDIHSSYGNHAAAYVKKPVGLAGFIDLANAIDNFWLHHVVFNEGKSGDSLLLH